MREIVPSVLLRWPRRSNLHLCESQGVADAFPLTPHNTIVPLRRVAAMPIETVEIGEMAAVVPPAAFVHHCTRFWV